MLAWDHALCRAVVGVYMRALLGDLRRRARLDGLPGGRPSTGAPGGPIRAAGRGGGLAFHALAAPTDEAIARVLAVVAARIRRLLERHGHGEGGLTTGPRMRGAGTPRGSQVSPPRQLFPGG